MERRRLTKRQGRISKPNLQHKPSDRLEGPFLRSERPECKEQPRETHGCDAHEKYELGCHRTKRPTSSDIVGICDMKERTPKTYRITTLLETMKNASLSGG